MRIKLIIRGKILLIFSIYWLLIYLSHCSIIKNGDKFNVNLISLEIRLLIFFLRDSILVYIIKIIIAIFVISSKILRVDIFKVLMIFFCVVRILFRIVMKVGLLRSLWYWYSEISWVSGSKRIERKFITILIILSVWILIRLGVFRYNY